MLEEVELDCVHICLPHHLHVSVTAACVEKGIHVLQEKPLSINAKEGLKLIQLEQKNPDTKICVCFQNRFNDTFQTLQQIVKSNKFGDIIGIKGIVTWFRPKSYYTDKPWRGKLDTAGGGVLINQAIHTLDLIQLLCGPVDTLKGNVSQLLDYHIEVEDTASAHIKFKNGANGMFLQLMLILEIQVLSFKSFLKMKSLQLKIIYLHVSIKKVTKSILLRIKSYQVQNRIMDQAMGHS